MNRFPIKSNSALFLALLATSALAPAIHAQDHERRHERRAERDADRNRDANQPRSTVPLKRINRANPENQGKLGNPESLERPERPESLESPGTLGLTIGAPARCPTPTKAAIAILAPIPQ